MAIIAAAFLTTMFNPILETSASPAVTLTIAMPGEAQKLDGTDPIFIAGLYNDITVTPAQAQSNLTVVLHSGTTYPGNRTDQNHYSFSWIGAKFSDDLYGSWLDHSNCSAAGGTYRFRVAINGSSKDGTWTIHVNGSGNELHKSTFKVVLSDVSLGLSSPSFVIKVEPKTPGTYRPVPSDHFRTVNDGNIPLGLSVSFNKLGDWMRVTNISTLHPGKEIIHSISIEAPSWDVGETQITGTVSGVPLFRGPKDVVGLDPAYSATFSVRIQVGRGGLELVDAGAFALQYPAALTMDYGNTTEYNFYLTGVKEVELTLSATDAAIKSITMDGKAVTSPITVSLVKGTEVAFAIKVKPTKDDTTVKVTYSVRTTDDTVQRSYITTVTVPKSPTPPPVSNEGRDRLIAIVFLAVTITAGSVVAYSIYEKSRRRSAMERRKRRKGRSEK